MSTTYPVNPVYDIFDYPSATPTGACSGFNLTPAGFTSTSLANAQLVAQVYSTLFAKTVQLNARFGNIGGTLYTYSPQTTFAALTPPAGTSW